MTGNHSFVVEHIAATASGLESDARDDQIKAEQFYRQAQECEKQAQEKRAQAEALRHSIASDGVGVGEQVTREDLRRIGNEAISQFGYRAKT